MEFALEFGRARLPRCFTARRAPRAGLRGNIRASRANAYFLPFLLANTYSLACVVIKKVRSVFCLRGTTSGRDRLPSTTRAPPTRSPRRPTASTAGYFARGRPTASATNHLSFTFTFIMSQPRPRTRGAPGTPPPPPPPGGDADPPPVSPRTARRRALEELRETAEAWVTTSCP